MPLEASRGYLLAVLPLLSYLHEGECSAGSRNGSGRQTVCQPGLEFWSVERASCWPCTTCAPQFTLSPCALHKDALCGPLSALELDWSFLATGKRRQPGQHSLEATKVTSKMLWRYPELEHQHHHQELRQAKDPRDEPPPPSPEDARFPDSAEVQTAHDERERRKASEESRLILWDWESGALVLAVCACILFFLVAGCSALVYARQWRRMKKNFEPAGLEEISARLNLMVKAELAELVAGAPMSPGDPETRCQYLEKLLDRKRETPVVMGWPEAGGNLYIEEGEPSRGRKMQIAQIHRNIETILNQKGGSVV